MVVVALINVVYRFLTFLACQPDDIKIGAICLELATKTLLN